VGPLKFIPILKRIRWGGRRLGELLNKPIGPFSDYAESWELCDLGQDQSLVVDGPCAGWSLGRLVRERPRELLGKHAGLAQFPLLVKYLDARDRLSVQVHPDDEIAATSGQGECGKTEAWVIVAAEEGSCLFAGLRAKVDQAALRKAIAAGSVEECLNRVEVAEGDCLFIPSGTVHAIGQGIVLAEVQQASDVTFRLFDWNRVDAQGQPRALHVEEALKSTNFARGPVHKVTPRKLAGGDRSEELVDCPYFTIRRHFVRDPLPIPDDGRCHVLMALEGHVRVASPLGNETLTRGETVLIPATALPVQLAPSTPATVLEIFWG